jgi:hypothetical protein
MPGGNVDIRSTGFGTPSAARDYSPALQQQVSLITADKDADYILFDAEDRPVRVVLDNPWIKSAFRNLRSEVLSGDESDSGRFLEAIAEYLIKLMGQRPGLSRERILRQLEKEYGRDIAEDVADFEKLATARGFEGSTFVEVMGRNLMDHLPIVGTMVLAGHGRPSE